MDKINLNAQQRQILGKKVAKLREKGQLPAHVFGKGVEGENVILEKKEFLKVLQQAGETGLISLKISKLASDTAGAEKVRPVLIREVQYNSVSGLPIHVDFFQVNLSEKVKVPVPLVLIGDEPETVKLGETIVLQTLSEVEVEALPGDLIEKIEVDITALQAIDDAITVGQLSFDRSKLTISVADEEIVVKLAPAVTAEMEALMEEAAAETAEAQAEATGEEGEKKEGEEGEAVEGEASVESGEAVIEGLEKAADETKPQE